jgi:Interferon-induced transmembrane protein
MTEFGNPSQEPAPKYPPPSYPPPSYPPPVGPTAGPPMSGPTRPQPNQPVYPDARPNAYWPLSVISFLLSCVVGGIAMFFSYQVGEKMKNGDVAGAAQASRMAQIISIVGIVIGVIVLLSTLAGGGF